jgi:hypothetical protein
MWQTGGHFPWESRGKRQQVMGEVMRIELWLLLAGISALATVPAQARGRDEVMGGAYGCAVIADDKQWLDCFYGAAQFVRAQLGLPAAPDAQVRLAAAPPSGGEVRNAMIRDEAMADAARCYSVADDRQWLNCYYNAVQPVRSALNLPPSAQRIPPVPVQAAQSPVFAMRKPTPVSVGGFSDWLGSSDGQRIISQLASYSFDKYNIFTVKLANGQVWRQQSGDTSYARWKKPPGSYTAIITRGALGSINLSIQGEPRSFKVSRIR